jgi:hypothetical protein
VDRPSSTLKTYSLLNITLASWTDLYWTNIISRFYVPFVDSDYLKLNTSLCIPLVTGKCLESVWALLCWPYWLPRLRLTPTSRTVSTPIKEIPATHIISLVTANASILHYLTTKSVQWTPTEAAPSCSLILTVKVVESPLPQEHHVTPTWTIAASMIRLAQWKLVKLILLFFFCNISIPFRSVMGYIVCSQHWMYSSLLI